MKKITSMIASALLLMGLSANAQITSPVITTGKLMTAEELNASEGTKRIAIQLVHSGNEYGKWYNTKDADYRSVFAYSNDVIFEWTKKDNDHILKFVSDNTYSGKTNPHTTATEADAELLHVANPIVGGEGANALSESNCRKEKRENFCRFVNKAGTWINSKDAGWSQGQGVWTVFYVYDLTNHIDGQVQFNAIQGSAITGLEAGSKLATFSSPVATKLPVGVRAFYVEAAAASDAAAQLKEIKGNIPANQGVILVSKNDTEVMTAAEGEVAPLGTSALKGSGNAYARDKDNKDLQNVYVLATQNGVTQFYKTSGKLAPNKAYLELSAAAATVALKFPGEATAIEGIEAAEETNAPIYDLSGRKVNNTVKGSVFIQNGKKFIAK